MRAYFHQAIAIWDSNSAEAWGRDKKASKGVVVKLKKAQGGGRGEGKIRRRCLLLSINVVIAQE